MRNPRNQYVSVPRRERRSSRRRNFVAFLCVSSLVVIAVLLSCSPWRGAADHDVAFGAANTPIPSFAIVGGTRTPSPTPVRKASATARSAAVTPTSSGNRQSPSRFANATATPTLPLTAAQLADQVNALVSAATAHVAVDIGLADGTILYEHEQETLYDSASLYKLGIMVEVYKQRDTDDLTFADPVTLYPGFFYEDDSVYSPDVDEYANVPVSELLDNMITLSSNVSAEALLNLVGTDNVNDTMAALGLTNTRILWSPAADNPARSPSVWVPIEPGRSTAMVPLIARAFPQSTTVDAVSSADGAYDLTTAADMAHLFEQLLSGTVISQADSADMLTLLSEQQINDRLPADLPPGTKVAHKTGDLDALMHDVGVIYAPHGPIVVVVMTDEITDHDATLALIRKIALLAYEYKS